MTVLAAPADPQVARARRPAVRPLPAWPLTVVFVAYPLWWVLGLAWTMVPVVGFACLLLMATRGRIRLPRMWLWWVAYLVWSLASVVMVDTTGRLIGFTQRWVETLGVTMIVLYVYNAREHLPRRRVLAVVSTMLAWITVGGYLGMAFPGGRITTPVQALLPPSLTANPYVFDLVSPRFAEVQHPYGAEQVFIRPSAPFPYTNGWGHAFVLLVPVVAALAVRATPRVRLLLAGLLVAAVPPALATLNRGIFIGLAVAALYLFARSVSRLRLTQLAGGAVAVAAAAAAVAASGVIEQITARTTTSSTTQDRAAIYREAFERTLGSPLLGWGTPRPSATLEVSVGTQGHFWFLMFSHGFVGLALFLGFFAGLVAVTWRVRDLESRLLHAVVIVMGVMLLFYGVDDLHLVIAAVSGTLLLRPERWAPR